MQYGYSYQLGARAGSLDPDGLSLDLQFAADKTLTARKGPTPVFTRASTATFVGSNGLIQSAAVNAPRFDHDPVTLACKGLLIEESRTNAAFYSGAIVINTGWLSSETTSVVDGVGPDGNNAYTVTETATTAIHTIANTGGVVGIGATSITSGTVYTGSIFIKKETGSVDWIQITLGSAGFGTAQYANFDIGTGVAGNFAGLASGTSPRIENYGNGWYRCSISVTATATTLLSLNTVLAFINNNNGTTRVPSYAGSTSNKVLANLCQFEAGSFATSYIPTVASSVVRSADVCSITGSDFSGFWNRFAGTCVVGVGSSLGNVPRFVSNAGSARTLEIYGTTNIDFFEAAGAQEIRVVTSPTYPIKLGLAYAINDYQSSYNGLLGGSDTNTGGTIPDATQLHIGNLGGGSNRLTGHIASIRYFKKRLANAKLVTLTT